MQYTTDDDIDNCLYYLRTFLNILRWSTIGTWGTLANSRVSIPKSDEATDSIGNYIPADLLAYFNALQGPTKMIFRCKSSFWKCVCEQ
jgi:hypothetical protein